VCAHDVITLKSVSAVDVSIAGIQCTWGVCLLAQLQELDTLTGKTAEVESADSRGESAQESALFGFVENYFSRISAVHSAYAALYFNLGVLAHHRASLCAARLTAPGGGNGGSGTTSMDEVKVRVEEAVVHYQRAVEIQPKYAAALFNWGCLVQLLGECELQRERLWRTHTPTATVSRFADNRAAVDHFLGAALKYCRASQVGCVQCAGVCVSGGIGCVSILHSMHSLTHSLTH
jgi:tetratricopeptide (TPR) repeat protein